MPKLILDGEFDKSKTFMMIALQETAGAWAAVTTSYAETDTPVQVLTANEDCENLREGEITQVKIRLNFANAVTYKVRIWRRASAGDYQSDSDLLWTSEDNLPANLADDVSYVDKLGGEPIVFSLEEMGKMYFGVEWSGAPGNIQGYIQVSGRRFD